MDNANRGYSPADERCIVVSGNLSDGFRFFGPFDSFDEAAEWCNKCNGDTWVATLGMP